MQCESLTVLQIRFSFFLIGQIGKLFFSTRRPRSTDIPVTAVMLSAADDTEEEEEEEA